MSKFITQTLNCQHELSILTYGSAGHVVPYISLELGLMEEIMK